MEKVLQPTLPAYGLIYRSGIVKCKTFETKLDFPYFNKILHSASPTWYVMDLRWIQVTMCASTKIAVSAFQSFVTSHIDLDVLA